MWTLNAVIHLTVWNRMERVFDKARWYLQNNDDWRVASPLFVPERFEEERINPNAWWCFTFPDEILKNGLSETYTHLYIFLIPMSCLFKMRICIYILNSRFVGLYIRSLIKLQRSLIVHFGMFTERQFTLICHICSFCWL